MTENFILAAFRKMGEDPLTVKLMKNKFSGEAAGYCFVSFVTDEAAQLAMHKLNGKPIPSTNPIVRFKLNSATTSQNKALLADREFSVWVGDLTSDVDDYNLYRVFSAKFQSIKTAKVIMDDSGFSRGYGFVKFGLEEEQKNALYEMNGYVGLGSKALKICSAVPKPKTVLLPLHHSHHQLQQSFSKCMIKHTLTITINIHSIGSNKDTDMITVIKWIHRLITLNKHLFRYTQLQLKHHHTLLLIPSATNSTRMTTMR